MIKGANRLILLTLIICFSFQSRVQANEVDSLKRLLSSNIHDTTRVNVLNALSKAYINSNLDSSIAIAMNAKKLANEIHFNTGFVLAIKNIGNGYYQRGKFKEAVITWQEAITIYTLLNDKKGVANMLSNQAVVYFNQGDDAKAMELNLQSLKIAEELNDTLRIVSALINLGGVYSNKKVTYNESLNYYFRAYKLSLIINDKKTIGAAAVNIGETYFKLGNYATALEYYFISEKAYKNTEDLPYTLNDIGKIYTIQKEFDRAINIHNEALKFSEKLDSKLDQTQSLVGLGQVYAAKGNINTAIDYFNKALVVANILHANTEIKEIYEGLSNCFYRKADFETAYKYNELLLAIKDTIYNIDIDQKMGRLQFKFDLEKKEAKITLLNKDKELKNKEIQRQKIVMSSFIGGFAIMLLFALVFFAQRNKIGKEKKRSEALLLNILPEETAEELKATGKAKTKSFELVSVLFTDFKNFTQASEILTPEELVEEINYCYSAFDRIITKYGIEKIKTIGDSYMCAGGLPVANKTNPFDIVAAGLEMVKFIEENKQDRIAKGQPYFELRLGVHSGPVVAGIVGIKKFAYDIWGDTVNTASRMESSGAVGRVNISGTTYEIVKDKFTCTHRGKIEAKNKGVIDMYFVER